MFFRRYRGQVDAVVIRVEIRPAQQHGIHHGQHVGQVIGNVGASVVLADHDDRVIWRLRCRFIGLYLQKRNTQPQKHTRESSGSRRVADHDQRQFIGGRRISRFQQGALLSGDHRRAHGFADDDLGACCAGDGIVDKNHAALNAVTEGGVADEREELLLVVDALQGVVPVSNWPSSQVVIFSLAVGLTNPVPNPPRANNRTSAARRPRQNRGNTRRAPSANPIALFVAVWAALNRGCHTDRRALVRHQQPRRSREPPRRRRPDSPDSALNRGQPSSTAVTSDPSDRQIGAYQWTSY